MIRQINGYLILYDEHQQFARRFNVIVPFWNKE